MVKLNEIYKKSKKHSDEIISMDVRNSEYEYNLLFNFLKFLIVNEYLRKKKLEDVSVIINEFYETERGN